MLEPEVAMLNIHAQEDGTDHILDDITNARVSATYSLDPHLHEVKIVSSTSSDNEQLQPVRKESHSDPSTLIEFCCKRKPYTKRTFSETSMVIRSTASHSFINDYWFNLEHQGYWRLFFRTPFKTFNKTSSIVFCGNN